MNDQRFQPVRGVRAMLLLLCVGLSAMASYSFSFGEEDDVDVTDKYVAEHKDQFRVETSVCKGSVKFTFTQFVHEPRYWLGYLKIRKAGRTLVDCQLLPAKAKSRVTFLFTVSQDVVSESEFVLYETGLARAFLPDGKPLVLESEMPQICSGTNYHFRLKEFVSGARQPDRNASSGTKR